MKKFFAMVTAFLTCTILAGCQKKEDTDFKIVTSCYPVYVMTANIAKGVPGVKTMNMCDSNTGCLHNFQLRSEDLKKIEQSSAFVVNGAGMENFLDRVINEIPTAKIIDSSEGVKLLEEEDECEHEEHCHHYHEYNPHIWMSVSNYIKQTQNIADGLKRLDPSHEKIYTQNLEEYVSKLNDLKTEIKSQLSGLEKKDIITFHEAFPYFAEEFGLNVVGVINHEPDEEPPVSEIREIVDLIKEKNISCIFVEPQYSQAIAQTIANETNAKIYVLDPAATGDFSLDSYLNTMKKNLEVLKEALK